MQFSKKHSFFLLVFQVIAILTISQTTKTNLSQEHVINKWLKAIVNLEASIGWRGQRNFDSMVALDEKRIAKKISKEDYRRIHDSLLLERSSASGTALFLEVNSKKYLITARHVVFDRERASKYDLQTEVTLNYIVDYIYRIPNSNEKIDTTIKESMLFGLGGDRNSFIFSDPNTDLAIISLNGKQKAFGDYLLKKGHRPISIKDIDTVTNLKFGQELICLGFPGLSILSTIKLDLSNIYEKSKLIAEPCVTFGKVATPNYFNNFIGDISVYPGNSGGPLISNNKLIGIVSAQPSINLVDSKGENMPYHIRIPYAIGIKASYIMPLLRELMTKELIDVKKP